MSYKKLKNNNLIKNYSDSKSFFFNVINIDIIKDLS